MSNLNSSNAINSGLGAASTATASPETTAILDILSPNLIHLTNESLISNDSSEDSTSNNSEPSASSTNNPDATNTDPSVTSNVASNSSTRLGFCHSCNKQNPINIEAFTCTQCNGGFIELFNNMNDTTQQAERTSE